MHKKSDEYSYIMSRRIDRIVVSDLCMRRFNICRHFVVIVYSDMSSISRLMSGRDIYILNKQHGFPVSSHFLCHETLGETIPLIQYERPNKQKGCLARICCSDNDATTD